MQSKFNPSTEGLADTGLPFVSGMLLVLGVWSQPGNSAEGTCLPGADLMSGDDGCYLLPSLQSNPFAWSGRYHKVWKRRN